MSVKRFKIPCKKSIQNEKLIQKPSQVMMILCFSNSCSFIFVFVRGICIHFYHVAFVKKGPYIFCERYLHGDNDNAHQ